MPRSLLAPVLATLATVAVLLAVAAGPAQAHSLKRGSHGARVTKLQRDLHLTPDGVFGPGTARAVRRFQRRHHLTADGIVGAATWSMIRRARGSHRATTARAGGARIQTRGASVELLQRRLGVAADGVFGPGTARAVRTFQRAHGLTADGIVGPSTWTALGVGGRHPVLRRAHLRGGAVHRSTTVLAHAIAAADRIAAFPYRYGGGHQSFHDSGYDCSGSVSYVLHAIGRLGRPRDSGELMHYGAPGRGRLITIYANASHAYMMIGDRRYDTTGRAETGSRWQREERSSAGYVVRHPPGL